MLYPHIRVNQIFGANTDVGKTIFATVLSLATASYGRRVFYLKPVSTGAARDADDLHIRRYKPEKARIKTRCIVQMDDPVSPHLAARDSKPISDKQLIYDVRQHVDGCARSAHLTGKLDAVYIETAGGVLSPAPSRTPQADAYRPLRLPVILVGDSRLGGISSTLSAYESLHIRGYDVISILLFENERYQNHSYLADHFAQHNIPVSSIRAPPSRTAQRNDGDDEKSMREYYAHSASTSNVKGIIAHLDRHHIERINRLHTLPKRAEKSLWYPFVQHKNIRGPEDITVVDSAHGDLYTCYSPLSSSQSMLPPSPPDTSASASTKAPLLHPKFDGSASWWTQGIGHASTALTSAAAYAAGRYGHVIYPQVAHEPALHLAETLLKTQGKGWASKVFFSDNGSTGIEVALKMAMRATASLYSSAHGAIKEKVDLKVLGLKGSYHGDTIGAMDACEGGDYNNSVEWYRGRGYWLDPPTLGWEDGILRLRVPWNDHVVNMPSLGVAYDVSARRGTQLEKMYKDYISTEIIKAVEAGDRFGALVMEPLLLGAAGMQFVDPLFQTTLVDVVRSMSGTLLPPPNQATPNGTSTLPVIFDEVFTGLGRLGFSSPSQVLDVKPDIAVYAKLLTGGLVPLAATLATKAMFECFIGEEKKQALLHGHSYNAYPVGCEVANVALKELAGALKSEDWAKARYSWENQGKMEGFIEAPHTGEEVMGSLWSFDFIRALSKRPAIKRVMTLGTVLAFELSGISQGYGSSSAERALASLKRPSGGAPTVNSTLGMDDEELSVHFRTLGNIGYLICSLNSEKQLIRRMEERLLHIFHA